MDTEAIWQAVRAYGASKAAREPFEADENMAEIKRLLNEAEAEHKSVLDENERLVDEVNEARKEIGEQARLNAMGAEREARLMAERDGLRAARIAYASEFPPIPDGDDAGLPAVDRIHENIRRLKAENSELKAKLTKKAELLRGCYARIDKLDKALRELHDATQLVSVGNYDQEAHDIAVSRARAALEKKHEGT